MTTTFYNVTISINAENPRDAYALLMDRMEGIAYETDTYCTNTAPQLRDTEECWNPNKKGIRT